MRLHYLLLLFLPACSGMSGKRVALVSGGNKGIGYEIAKGLAREGFATVLGCRDCSLGEAACLALAAEGFEHVTCERLDLDDSRSWTECAEAVRLRHGRLDVLCNNAAVCFNDPTLYGACEHTSFERQAEVTIATNFFGTLGVTRAFLPLLRAAPSPKVINVASAAGRLSILRSEPKTAALTSPKLRIEELESLMRSFVSDVQAGVHAKQGWPNTCYGTSKIGVIAMTRVLARDEPSVAFNAVDPGYCATDQNHNAGSLPAAVGAKTPVKLATLADSTTGKFFSYTGAEIDWLTT